MSAPEPRMLLVISVHTSDTAVTRQVEVVAPQEMSISGAFLEGARRLSDEIRDMLAPIEEPTQ